MARYAQFDFYQQSPSTLDVPPSEEDEMSVLDDKILDSTSPGLSDPRRPSYDTDPTAFSHRNSVWSNYSHASSDQSQSRPSHLPHSVLDSTSGQFMAVDGPQPYAPPQASWALSRTASGSCTPTAYDQYPSEAEQTATSGPFSGGAVGPVGAIPMGAVSYRGAVNFAAPPGTGGVAMSPQSSQGWMPAPMDLSDAAAVKSNCYRNGSPLTLRRDGIRKKNARFEIPAERTLSNIDQLISQSTNEEEVKELKQQKRLLRNRQAALDSRQRKKLHTEKLEEEKKHYTHTISQLEDIVSSLQKREAELMREKNEWIAQQQQITTYLESMHMEKDEMIRSHTLETAELRKKNNILLETVEKLERGGKPTMADQAQAHAHIQTADFTGFENLSMDTGPWDEFGMANGLPMDTVSASHVHTQSQAQAHPQSQPLQVTERAADKPASDYPFSWNAFYMCLLFGAFIASNANTSLAGRSLPQLSEEYRAESANVLKAVLASSPPDLTHPSAIAVSASAPQPSITMDMTQMGASHARSSTLDELHDTLVLPSEEQERAQVFSLNVDQYNSLTTFEDDGAPFKAQPSNLQAALAAMRSNAAQHRVHGGEDVYSRSLMWERVPEKVIRDFRRMVQEFGGSPVKEEMMTF
ncbi:uncharacterized protein N7473_012582 [Penicillium subrubescens]|uniref:BZIP domain-containing protein n=1 Tax=Penicillium subrubescens TaxID=1316194 RepID=A0A1Q5U4R3_9EURO|nr:uncharacterized protein N7473_012582 [Penicillium subrubescens]KAJ5875235.1 hypothetical protein N7473_012582 [Penicillium subrubescens]OKP07473.1 hypothetical protein PENSUB_6062 [Penicillium subrubescens]